jgi:hypothetical protein
LAGKIEARKEKPAACAMKFEERALAKSLQSCSASLIHAEEINGGAVEFKGDTLTIRGEALYSGIVHKRPQFAQGPSERRTWVIWNFPQQLAQRVAPLRRAFNYQIGEQRARLLRLRQRHDLTATANLNAVEK